MAPITSAQLVSKVNTERFWLALSLGMIAASAVVPDENRLGLAVKLFLFVVGTVNGGLIFFEWVHALNHKHGWQQAELSAFRLSQGLPLPEYEYRREQRERKQREEQDDIDETSEPLAPVEVFTPIRTLPSAVAVTIKHYTDPPTRRFLQVLFETSRATDGRIRSEAGFAELGKEHGWTGSQSNVWLTYTDEQLITEKIYKSATGNSPRRLVPGMSLKLALAKFGMAESDDTSPSSFAPNQA